MDWTTLAAFLGLLLLAALHSINQSRTTWNAQKRADSMAGLAVQAALAQRAETRPVASQLVEHMGSELGYDNGRGPLPVRVPLADVPRDPDDIYDGANDLTP